MSVKQEKRLRRHRKIRKKIHGTKNRPRLCVFRSNQHIYAQLIDDDKGKILFSISDIDLKLKKSSAVKSSGLRRDEVGLRPDEVGEARKSDIAKEVGKLMAKTAKENKIEKVVFDRGGVLYHGRVKALAEGAREGGLRF